MRQTEATLMPDEHIVFKTHLHWITSAGLIGLAVACVGASLASLIDSRFAPAVVVLVPVALICVIVVWLKIWSSEFAVTNRRLVIRHGILTKNSIEMLLSKVETMNVEQSVLARIFNYGTVTVKGTGGTAEEFRAVRNPEGLRTAALSQIDVAK